MPKTEGDCARSLRFSQILWTQKTIRSLGKSSINIVIEKLGTSAVNVSDAVAIGETMWNNFETRWSDGFYGTIPKKVTTMAVTNKSVPVGETKVHDIIAIYSSVIGLLASGREIDLKDLFSRELALVPVAMFNAKRDENM